MLLEGPDPLEIWPRSSGANPPLRNSENRDKGGVAADCGVHRDYRVITLCLEIKFFFYSSTDHQLEKELFW